MAGKKFAAEFALRRNVSALDKILIQDSDDDVVKYAYPPQIAALSGYAYAKSIADLPLMPTNKSIGYIVGQMLYIYVGMGGDTKDGLYQSVGFFVGPQGVQGEKGEQGERGEQGIQGPKGDNGGLSLQELDAHLATKQYVTADTLAEMLAGYVSNTSLMRDYVTIAKTQDVTGVKNFTAGLQFGGVPMYKSKGDTVFLDGNLVVRGSITAFGTNETISPSIFEALPIDGVTLKRTENGVLYVASGGSGGTGGGISIADVESYLTTNGYATQNWVTGKGYITNVVNDNVTINGNRLQPLYIKSQELSTGILFFTKTQSATLMYSGDSNWRVTDNGWGTAYYLLHSGNYSDYALPKDGTAASAYKLNAITGGSLVANTWNSSDGLSVSGWNTDGGWNTKYGTSLNISGFNTWRHRLGFNTNGVIEHWAAINTTTMSKVGDIAYVANIPTKLSQLTDDVVSGKYLSLAGGTVNGSITATSFIGNLTGNADSATTLKTSTGYVYARAFNVDKIVDIGADATFQGYSTYIDGMYIRFRYGSANATAMQIGTDGKVAIGGATALDKLHVYGTISSENTNADAGLRARGSIYALFFGIGSGNVNRGIYDDYHQGWWIMRGADKTTTIDGSMVATGFRINQTAFDNGLILNRTVANAGVGIMCKSNGIHLGGFGINGTKTFEISGDNGIVAQVSTETGNTMIIHGAGSYKEGIRLANRNGKTSTWSGIHLGCDPSATEGTHSTQWLVGRNGNNNYFVVRNNTTDYLQIDLSGNLLIKGAFTMNYSSDERLKKNIRKVNASEVLMSLGGVWQYEYIDSEVAKNSVYGGTHFGLIYQNVRGKSLDKMCHKREDGMGALNYVDADFISIIAGATMENISEVEKLKKENKALRKRVEQLEKRIA